MVFDYFSEGGVVGYALVEIEVLIDDFLDDLRDFEVEGKADVFRGVDRGGNLQGGVLLQPVHHLAEGDAVFGSHLDAESVVEVGDDAGKGFQLLRRRFALIFGAHRLQFVATSFQCDFSIADLLNLARQFFPLYREQAPQMAGELV